MKHKKILFMIVYIIISLSSYAQQQTVIPAVLDKYGKEEGSTLVQLSKEGLSTKSNITYYKSLSITNIDSKREKEILSTIDGNVKKWETMSEVREGGIVQSATYSTSSKDKKVFRYVLIGNKNYVWNSRESTKKTTVIYIEGDFPPNKLQAELKELRYYLTHIKKMKM